MVEPNGPCHPCVGPDVGRSAVVVGTGRGARREHVFQHGVQRGLHHAGTPLALQQSVGLQPLLQHVAQRRKQRGLLFLPRQCHAVCRPDSPDELQHLADQQPAAARRLAQLCLYSVEHVHSPVGDTGEGVSAHAGGVWTFRTNQWYRYALRLWTPADGTPHVTYMGGWLKDTVTGIWTHSATAKVPFLITALGGLSSFQENFGGSTTQWRTDYRNVYSYTGSGSWQEANQFTAGANGGWNVNCTVIESGTVAVAGVRPEQRHELRRHAIHKQHSARADQPARVAHV